MSGKITDSLIYAPIYQSNGKGFSWRFQAINNLLISAQFVGYDVGYRAVIALISVSFFTVYAANVPMLMPYAMSEIIR